MDFLKCDFLPHSISSAISIYTLNITYCIPLTPSLLYYYLLSSSFILPSSNTFLLMPLISSSISNYHQFPFLWTFIKPILLHFLKSSKPLLSASIIFWFPFSFNVHFSLVGNSSSLDPFEIQITEGCEWHAGEASVDFVWFAYQGSELLSFQTSRVGRQAIRPLWTHPGNTEVAEWHLPTFPLGSSRGRKGISPEMMHPPSTIFLF